MDVRQASDMLATDQTTRAIGRSVDPNELTKALDLRAAAVLGRRHDALLILQGSAFRTHMVQAINPVQLLVKFADALIHVRPFAEKAFEAIDFLYVEIFIFLEKRAADQP
jgi:hypothetical protein